MAQLNAEQLKKVLHQLYFYADGFDIPKSEERRIRRTKSSALYGEITFGGLQKLLDYLELQKNDVFYDLGSGVGKVVLQAALSSNAKKYVGVELSKDRFLKASQAATQFYKSDLLAPTRCEFRWDNILKTNLHDASVVYTCSTAFTEKFMQKLVEKLGETKPGLILVSLRELPRTKRFKEIDILRLDMTWERKSPVFVYERVS